MESEMDPDHPSPAPVQSGFGPLKLELLDADHADAVLAFELENREFFARTVSDRGDGFFSDYASHHELLLKEQSLGTCRFHVLVDGNGAVLGRLNLYDLMQGTADLGYRIAERATGKGVATAGVLKLCEVSAADYELHRLRAKVLDTNVASQRVLIKAGFVRQESARLDIGDGAWYERVLIR
jgi:[ribosomal protein S5]-alanine N-acetyltransferase